jgi:hypothetical protein
MIEIPLSGKYHYLTALVDDDDEWVTQWEWYAMPRPRTTYVSRPETLPNGRRTSYLLHRVIMGAAITESIVLMEIDHRNGDGLDNRRANLRLATPAQNARNRPLQSNNTSGVKGVDWYPSKKKWRARIKVNNKYIDLGLFDYLEDAKKVREAAAAKYFREFQRL